MTTKQLAKELGLIRRSSKLSLNTKNVSSPISKQFFQYLIIIDFESTCWKDTKHYGQEIIEFPAVLLNTSSGEIESEFHTYVQPQEHPILSNFCTELTGIQQQQVDDGVPLKICLSQFSNWIQKLQKDRGIIFPSVLPIPSTGQKMCAFVTWSDWDLGVCLLYECKRKQLRKPDILNSWIDLRLTYKMFYNRKPKGLNGALQDVGIEFSGREHSGLDDSRNTARLAWRMICDGCVMKITKSLEKVQPHTSSGQSGMVLPVQANGQRTSDQTSNMTMAKDKQDSEENCTSVPTGTIGKDKHTLLVSAQTMNKKDKKGKQENSISNVTQTLINGLTTTLGSGNRYKFSSQKSLGLLQRKKQIGTFTSTPVNASPQGPSHVLFSTTIVSVSDVSNLEQDSSSDLSILAEWEEAAVIEDSQEQAEMNSDIEEPVLLPVDSPSFGVLMLQNDHEKLTLQPKEKCIQPQRSNLQSKSVVYQGPDTTIYSVNMKKHVPSTSTFKLPNALGYKSDMTGLSAKQTNHFPSVLDYFPKRKLSSVSFSSPPRKLPFTVHEDRGNCSLSVAAKASRPSPRAILNSTVNLNSTIGSAKHVRITAPMCSCGRRARKLTVSNGGPNQGRNFFTCAVRKRDDQGKGCNYFKWEDALMKEKSVNTSLILSTSSSSSSKNSLNCTVVSESNKTFKLRPSLRT
ncbi:ERI1 exoribonuclease 2 [Gastrophryne carolinensis]